MARSTYLLSKCDLSIYRQLLQPFICLHHKNWWFLQIKRWYTFLKYKTSPGSFWEFFSDGLLSDVNLPATGQSLSLRNLIWKYYVLFFLVFMTDNFSFVLRNNNETPRWRGRRVPCSRHLGHRGKGKYPWSIHEPWLQSTLALRTYRYNEHPDNTDNS